MKNLNGLSKYIEIRKKTSEEKAYIKDTRIPLDFLLNTFKSRGSIAPFLRMYPWLKVRKNDLLLLVSALLDKGTKHALYD